MVLEELRLIHEDNERLEAAIADRLQTEPVVIKRRRARDHEIAGFLERIRSQSERAGKIYKESTPARIEELRAISVGEPFLEFQRRYDEIKNYHKRNPGEPAEDLERAYKRRATGDDDAPVAVDVDNMFTGEEAHGRYFDLLLLHEEYINLPKVKRRPTYLQYLDQFDQFEGFSRQDKLRDEYFRYVTELAQYLENFMRRIKPLENLDKLFATFDEDFERAWEKDEVPDWKKDKANGTSNGPTTQGTGEGIWCADCEREFPSQGTYKSHLTGKKHARAVAAKEAGNTNTNGINGSAHGRGGVQRLKEKAVAEREWRVKKLAKAMSTERSDTKVNVERKQVMTEKERQQEQDAANQEETIKTNENGEPEEDEEEKIRSNPLKLPMAWDGKPIPYWLFKLHGLDQEFPCEICGNHVYQGRRAFEKHFSEARHLYGLKCLGITNSSVFREVTGIEEAKALWEKILADKKKETAQVDDVVQMEDSMGNVMPAKVYYDLQKAGLL